MNTIYCLCILSILTCASGAALKHSQRNNETEIRPAPKKSNIIFCALSKDEGVWPVVGKPGISDTFNFSFSAYFHNKELLKAKSLRRLAQTFSQHSFCETRFMKYNHNGQRMEYYAPSDPFLWHSEKHLNWTTQPVVYIVRERVLRSNGTDKRRVVFECKLPRPDVAISMKPDLGTNEFRPIQSHPLPANRVTVSGLHLKLNFMQIENLVINFQDTKRAENVETIVNEATDSFLSNKKPIERYFVYYDSKCRLCGLNEANSSTPLTEGSLNCSIKTRSCEHDGGCYSHGEIYSPYLNSANSERPSQNMPVCNSNYSQTSLYMPCSVDNGGCGNDKKCHFDALTFETRCE